MHRQKNRTRLGVVLIVVALALSFAMLFGFVMFDEREGPRPGVPPTESALVRLTAAVP